MQETFDQLKSHVHQTSLLQTAADTLEWDERTRMPPAAGDYREQQVTLLRGMIHTRRTNAQLGEWLQNLTQWDAAADPTSDIGATVHRMREDFERDSRLPQRLVEALAGATMRGQRKWDAARKADDFSLFRPVLEEVIALKREAAACLAKPGQELYDALVDEYEPGAKAADLQVIFSSLRDELVRLLDTLRGAPRRPDVSILRRDYAVEAQRSLSQFAAAQIGYDFDRGRLDETSHPFCTNLGPDDCRILTRYEKNWLPGGFFGTLHEAGHGMYDQGLRREWYGLPPGSFVSLGIHESQSRMWENLVGRSRPFWEFFFPYVRRAFPGVLDGIAIDDFHFAVNDVRPSLIRVEADEATYNLHIIVRFELEQQLVSGDLAVGDLPAAWNERYESVLGIRPPSDADGVLQDVHWSAGLLGYFPTYTLGNIYAAQLFDAAAEELGELDTMFARGDFAPLLEWMRRNVHTHGRCYSPHDLIAQATGGPPESHPLVNSLKRRYAKVYGF